MTDRHHLPADGGPPAWPPEQTDQFDDRFRNEAAQGFHPLPAIWRLHHGARYLPWERDPRPHENERPSLPHRQIAMPHNLPEDGGPDGASRMPFGHDDAGDGNGGQRPTPREHAQGARYMPWQNEPDKLGAKTEDAEGMQVTLSRIEGVTPDSLFSGDPTDRSLAVDLMFQCPPMDEFSIQYAHTHNDYETVRQQLSRKNVPQLATFDFQTLAVDWGCYVVNKETYTIDNYIGWFRERLKKICLSGAPVYLTAAHQSPGLSFLDPDREVEVSMPVTLRQVKVTEKAGEGDARYFDLSFVEFRDAEIVRKGLGRAKKRKGSLLPTTVIFYPQTGLAVDSHGRPVGLASDTIYTITLSWLARHFYKDPHVATDIARWNHIKGWPNGEPLANYPPYQRVKRGHAVKLRLHTLDEAELVDRVVDQALPTNMG